jgi:hypothetical protein
VKPQPIVTPAANDDNIVDDCGNDGIDMQSSHISHAFGYDSTTSGLMLQSKLPNT